MWIDRSYDNNKEEQDSEEGSEDSEDHVESEYGVSLPDGVSYAGIPGLKTNSSILIETTYTH
jgi:hypothetical protein